MAEKDSYNKGNHNQENGKDTTENQDKRIEEMGQVTLKDNVQKQNIHLLSIIGEVEGHDNLSSNSKTTKYEHVLPQLAAIVDDPDIVGLLILIITVGIPAAVRANTGEYSP